MEVLAELGVAVSERFLDVALELAVNLLVLLNRLVVLLRGLGILFSVLRRKIKKESSVNWHNRLLQPSYL